MSLPKPHLDDRSFQNIVDEAKTRIAQLDPSWTDHNVSDPGVTLIELFAWMTELLIYRLNKVPETSQITFLELMGVRLRPQWPAQVPLTFRLTKPLSPGEQALEIPVGFEVMTRQQRPTWDDSAAHNGASPRASDAMPRLTQALIFSVDKPVGGEKHLIHPPATAEPALYIAASDDEQPQPFVGDDREVFRDVSKQGASFWIGTPTDVSNYVLELAFTCITTEGVAVGIEPENPPLVWQVWRDDTWHDVPVEGADGTRGFTQDGTVMLRLPPAMQQGHSHIPERHRDHFWLRVLFEARNKQRPYTTSPQVQSVRLATRGITVPASHATLIYKELLGRSDGTPGQRFQLANWPVLPLAPSETVQVQGDDGKWDDWQQPGPLDFSDSRPHRPKDNPPKYFVLDYGSGVVRFGPQVREPSGEMRQYGAVPEKGRLVRMSRYRIGGGVVGNVPAKTLTEPRRALSYIESVTNYEAATGGSDAETIEHAKLRGPAQLRTRGYAITASDYEFLVAEQLRLEPRPGVARSRCLSAFDLPAPHKDPNTVHILLVPHVPFRVGKLDAAQFALPQRLREAAETYLKQIGVLTVRAVVAEPTYVAVKVFAQLKALTPALNASVLREATERLYRFLHPLYGGHVGGDVAAGWPFGRALRLPDLILLLQTVPGLAYIQELSISARPLDGSSAPQPAPAINDDQRPVELAPNELFISDEHQVQML